MAKHARYGPSSLDALNRCIRFKYGDMNEDAAAEGTMLHEALETGDLAGLTEDQKEDVRNILQYIESLKTGPGTWEDLKEVKVKLEDLTYGTADRILVNTEQRLVHVIDGKFTRVAGDHSYQARTYGAAYIEMNGAENFDKVHTHIVAPRLNVLELGEYDPAELLTRVRQDIEALYARIADPFNPPTPEGDLCAKCARAARCTALSQTAVQTCRGMGLPLPAVFDPGAVTSNTDRALAQAIAGALENWAKQVKQRNTEFAKLGGEIPGFALRSRSTGTRLAKEDTPAAFAILKACNFDEDNILQACKLSIPDLAKHHAATAPESEKATKEKIKNVLGALTREGASTFLQKTKKVSSEQLVKQLTQGTT